MMNKNTPDKIICEKCYAAPFCFSGGLTTNEFEIFASIIEKKHQLQTGNYLFHANDSFKNYYVVKQGAFKTFLTTEDGREQINGFYLPGEIIGLDASSVGRYEYSAVAVTDHSIVCEILFEKLLQKINQQPELQRHMIQLMSQQLHNMNAIPRNTHALEKIAAFLINVSLRYYHHDPANNEHIRLPMSRHDIADYLGLAIETVSRIFSQFKHDAILAVEGKEITIIDAKKLHKMALCSQE